MRINMNGQAENIDDRDPRSNSCHHPEHQEHPCETNGETFESRLADANHSFVQSLNNSNNGHEPGTNNQLQSNVHSPKCGSQDTLSQSHLINPLFLPSPSTPSTLSSSSFPAQPSEQNPQLTSLIQNNTNNQFVPRTKLFVGRLPESCSSDHLEDLFGKFGTVTECDVVGRYGFVHMSKPDEAEECVKKLNKFSFMGSLLTVEFSTSKVHPEPGTLGRAKGVSRMCKGIRTRIHLSPYHRDPYSSHRPASLGQLPPPPHSASIALPPPQSVHQHPPVPTASASVPLPGRLYGPYSSPYYPDHFRSYERDIFYESDYYARERDRHYPPPPPHDHRPAATVAGGVPVPNYEFDSRAFSPPPPPTPTSIGPPPPPPPPPPPSVHYPMYPSHRTLPIRAYERPVIDEPVAMYSPRGSMVTSHKCHYHKCHYDMHVKPYLN